MSHEKYETYLGDGVYAYFEGHMIWLVTNDGYRETNRIALAPEVYDALMKFHQAKTEIKTERHS